MPITLPPLTRRDWLKHGTAAAIGSFATQLPALEIPEQIWVLFSDTHIAEDEALVARGACMAENLRRCANQVLKIGQKPFGLIVNGDCAYLEGISEDYVTFLRCIQPLREQSIQIHCTLGNHDHRNNFLNAVIGPPPPTAGGVHVIEMLNILEDFDVASLGFGTTAVSGSSIRIIAIGMFRM